MHLSLVVSCVALLLFADDDKPKAPVDPIQQMRESKEYQAAYAKAQAEADKAIKGGRAVLFTYGLRMMADNLDKETGLPIEAIAGCIVNDEILGRAAGNNDRIKEFVAKNGLPKNSMKTWEKELFDLKAYAASQTKLNPPKHLVVGVASTSPDGKFTIRAVPTKLKKEDGTPTSSLGLVYGSNGKELPTQEFFWSEDAAADLIWGPEASGFAVLISRFGTSEMYHAIDVRTGQSIRQESKEIPAKPGA